MSPHKKPLSSIRLPAIRNKKLNSSMGCASSQAGEVKGKTVVLPLEPTAPPAEDQNENNNVKIEEISNNKNDAGVKYPPAEAFEIPLDDICPTIETGGDSLIKKHPPKRLQRLVEQQPPTQTTIEDLEEKLANAEIRRQKYLQQKVDTVLSLAQPNKQDEDDYDDSDKNDNSKDNNDEGSRSPGDGDENKENQVEK